MCAGIIENWEIMQEDDWMRPNCSNMTDIRESRKYMEIYRPKHLIHKNRICVMRSVFPESTIHLILLGDGEFDLGCNAFVRLNVRPVSTLYGVTPPRAFDDAASCFRDSVDWPISMLFRFLPYSNTVGLVLQPLHTPRCEEKRFSIMSLFNLWR